LTAEQNSWRYSV